MKFFYILLTFWTCALQGENWMNEWFHASQHLKKREFTQAIDKYTQSIAVFPQAGSFHEFHLYQERGQAYAGLGQYEQAIADFTFIINHPHVPDNEKANALWQRGQAYMRLQQMQECRNDFNSLERLQPLYVVNYTHFENYVIFKMSDRMRFDKNLEWGFVQMLLQKRFITSKDDVIFTTTGMGIIKKAPEAPPLPILH